MSDKQRARLEKFLGGIEDMPRIPDVMYVVDATDVPLGRLSAVVASVLRGKNKPTFHP